MPVPEWLENLRGHIESGLMGATIEGYASADDIPDSHKLKRLFEKFAECAKEADRLEDQVIRMVEEYVRGYE